MTARRRRAIAGLVVALSSVVVLSSPASPVSAAGETGLVSIDPARLLDTRSGSTTIDGTGSGGGPTEAGVPVVVDVVGRGVVPADGVSAVVVNVTVDNSATANAGYVTVYPTGDPTPLASSLNFAAGAVVAVGKRGGVEFGVHGDGLSGSGVQLAAGPQAAESPGSPQAHCAACKDRPRLAAQASITSGPLASAGMAWHSSTWPGATGLGGATG